MLRLALILVVTSCAAPPAPLDGATPDAGVDPLPILERPADLRYGCSISAPLVSHAPLAWIGERPSLAVQPDGTFVLARLEAEGSGSSARTRLLVSPLTPSGLGTGLEVPSDPAVVFATALASTPAGWALVWGEGGEVRFARQEGAGVSAPRVLATPGGTVEVVHLAPSGAGHGVMWQTQVADQPQELFFVRADAQGVLLGEPTLLARAGGAYYHLSASLAARDDGLVAMFYDTRTRRMSTVAIDAGGLVSAPREVPLPSAPEGSMLTEANVVLVATPSGYLAAWSESSFNDDFSNPMGHAVIRLQPLAPDGTPLGAPQLLARAEPDINAIEPRLAPIHGSIALVWARGTQIYVCGGCMPDHRLRLVLLDPDRLVPTSDVLADIGAEAASGLVRHDLAASGSDLASAFHITYHVSSDPGSTFLRCDPGP